MTTPIDPIARTAAGWPYLADNAPVADIPIFTQELAAALAGFTPGSGAPVGDTGWVDARALVTWPTAPAWSGPAAASGWRALSYRRIGAQVWWTGLVQPAAAGTNASQTVFTIPEALANLRPAQTMTGGTGGNTTANSVNFGVTGAGVVSCTGTWAAGALGFSLTYPLG